MKLSKLIIILCAVCMMVAIALPFISNFMQGHYKAQLDDFTNSPQELQEVLNRKTFWADLGEGWISLYIFISCAAISLAVFLFGFIKKRRSNGDLR